LSIENRKKSCHENFGDRLREARKILGITQIEAAGFAEVSVQSWREYEAGRSEPKVCAIAFLVERKISSEWLFFGQGEILAQRNQPVGLLEEWLQHVREHEGHDGRVVAFMMRDNAEFRSWLEEKEKKTKANVA